MKKVMILALAVIMISSAAAMAEVMDFEDLYQGTQTYGSISSPYHGFIMGPDDGYITKNRLPGTGYENGTTGNVAMISYYARPITLASGQDFSVEGFDLTAALSNETVIVQGWRDGLMIYSDDVMAYTTGPTSVSLNYAGIDTLKIIPTGYHIVVDNLLCNSTNASAVPAPLPPTLVLFGMGLLGLAGFRGFRRN